MVHFIHLIIALQLLVGTSATVSIGRRADAIDDAGREWVDSVYASMSERERVAQLFVPRLDISDNAAGRAQLTTMVHAGIGGFLLGKGTIKEYASLIALGQRIAKVPLMVTLDGEWGLAMRLSDAPRFPHNMALGAIDDTALLEEYGRETARECKALGIHVDFAPVLDVNSNPANPVIGFRSFGEDPERVVNLGVAYSRGMEGEGVLSVAKHFPGHGDTSTDSHKTLPTVNHDRKTLDNVDLMPFKAYIDRGLSGVMVGHLNVPALDNSGTPASMSSKVTSGLLKEEMGFGGLVFTDALAMKGASSASVNNCVRALDAGADILLGSGSPLADIDAVVKAVKDGKIPSSVIEARVKKVLRYKWAMGLSERPPERSVEEIAAEINSPEAEAVNRRLSAASITVVKNDAALLPVRGLGKRTVAVVSIGASAINDFSSICRRYADVDLYATDGPVTASTLAKIRKHDVIIAAVFSDKKEAQSALAQLDNIPDVIPVFFMNPYRIGRFSGSVGRHKTLVAAFDDTPYLREYAAQAVFGGIDVDGRCPVDVKGVFRVGDGVSIPRSRLGFSTPEAVGMKPGLRAAIDSMVLAAIRDGAFPGCQVLVAKDGKVVVDGAYGRTTKDQHGHAVTPETLYDIASMTKAVATVGGVMKARDEGLLDIDRSLSEYIAGLDSLPVGRLTLRQLLTHESGLPATINVFKIVMDTASYDGPLTSKRRAEPYTLKIEDGLYGNSDARLRGDLVASRYSPDFDLKIGDGLYVGMAAYDTIMSRIYNLSPGDPRYRYSDLNFCLLMAAEEAATEVAHDQWVDLELFQPLGAYNTLYRPADTIPLDRIAPTEHDNFLRRQTVHGYVHDELAAMSGGVQGNAGLFSTAEDIAKYASMLLDGGMYGAQRILDKETVDLFTLTRAPGSGRGLGFDRPKVDGVSPLAYGHTGFTGTCFWVDPDKDLIFVFLSNRINPTRSNTAFSRSNIRNRLLSAVYSHL